MRIKQNTILSIFVIIFLIIPSVFQCNARADETVHRILILPFQINAPNELDYLKNAVMDMLSSRLWRPGMTEIVSGTEPATGASEALALGIQHDAAYVVMGSMTIFGNEISTDASIFKSGDPTPAIIFHELGKTEDGVLMHVEKLAERIHQGLFEKEASAGITAQPEVDSVVSESIDAQTQTTDQKDGPLWQSQVLNYRIVGMGVGDVDGDGEMECVLASEDTLSIYQFQQKNLRLLSEISQKAFRIIGVDVADINGNRNAEIFITRVRDSGQLNSVVLEWNGKEFVQLPIDAKMYFRVIKGSDKKRVLLGQKQGNITAYRAEVSRKDLFEAGIYTLQWHNGTYALGRKMTMSDSMEIFGYAVGDITGTGEDQVIRFSDKEFLELFDKKDGLVWRSVEPYGGSVVYLETFITGRGSSGETERHYLTQRILVADIDDEGKDEVIVPQNEDAVGRIFKRYRNFKDGHVSIFAWENGEMKRLWQTEKHTGYIGDMTLADINKDGRDELVYCTVNSMGTFSKRGKSRLYCRDMPDL